MLFGKASGFSDISLNALTLAQGYRILGEISGDWSGYSVSGTGDVNKDGYADLIIGAPYATNQAGKSYVIFGKASGFSDISLSKLTTTQGFRILGENIKDASGYSVSSAGDVNNDGFEDVIIGASQYYGGSSTGPGKSYVIFGKATGFSDISLSTLNSTQGFRILGESSSDQSGYSVSGAGDVNKDGYADIIIGAISATSNAGKSYVLFGKASGFTDISLKTLSPTQGFRILGENANDHSGVSVSGAGDVNGDGYADVIIGASGAGKSYVIFGKATGFSDINLSALTPTQGFRILGETSGDYSGRSVSGAGDINKDGYADIIIGAPWATSDAGKSYVIFGKASGFSDISLKTLSTIQGFRILGENGGDYSGYSVSSAGDVNKDGYADIIIGADNPSNSAGKSYVLFATIPLQVTANSAITTYGTIPPLTESYSGFVNSEDPSNLEMQPMASTNATFISSPGVFTITSSGGVSSHYYFIYIDGMLTINKALLQVTANNVVTTYGALPVLIESYSGFVNSESPQDLTIQPTVSTTTTTTSSPGNYTIAVAGGVSDNYDFTYINGTLTINKTPLQVTANNVTAIYETNIPVLAVSYSGFVNSEGLSSLIMEPTATTTATAISDPGVYPITVSGGVSNNYDFKYVDGYLTIYKSDSHTGSSLTSAFITIGIPVISGMAALASLIYTLHKCKSEGICCFKKAPAIALAATLLSSQIRQADAAQIDTISEDNIYYDQENDIIGNNELTQAVDY